MELIDARGYSCPQPVLMAKKAFESGKSTYTLLVDTIAAKENVTRFSIHSGFQVSVSQQDGDYSLTIYKD